MKKSLSMLGSLVLGIVGAFLLGVIGYVIFATYGGNACGLTCNCFCCNWFQLRGYESCGQFGLWLGGALGVLLLGWVIYRLVKLGKR